MRNCWNRRNVVAALSVLGSLLASSLAASDAGALESPPPGKALVYIMQADTGAFATVPAVVNGRQIARLAPNTAVGVVLNPGTHEFSTAGSSRGVMSVTVEAQGTYYVSQRINSQGGAELRLLPGTEGVTALGQSRLTGPNLVSASGAPAQRTAAPTAAASVAKTEEAPKADDASDAAGAAVAAPRGKLALIVTGGSFELDEPRQVVAGLNSQFEAKSSPAFAAELEYRHPSGVALGGELLLYTNKVATVSGALQGEQDVAAFLVNGKYYLGIADIIYPFIGAGFGSAAASYSGDITGSGAGFAGQVFGGVELRVGAVGLYAQYKKLSATAEDADGEKVKVDGSGAFVGLSLSF
jgi:hypothetical protein